MACDLYYSYLSAIQESSMSHKHIVPACVIYFRVLWIYALKVYAAIIIRWSELRAVDPNSSTEQ